MQQTEVHRVIAELLAAGCRSWISGGWAVDVLVGRQTRSHRDLDFEYPPEGFAEGHLDDVGLPCLSLDQQWRFRQGHRPREVDRHDVALLHAWSRSSRPI